MAKSKFTLIFISGVLGVLIGHFAFVKYLSQGITSSEALKIEGSVLVLALIGLFIMLPEVGKKREQFVARFLIMTTIQMLAVLSLIVLIALSGKANFKTLGTHQVSVFAIVMVVQSILLGLSRK